MNEYEKAGRVIAVLCDLDIAVTVRFNLGGYEAALYRDGLPSSLFVDVRAEGATMRDALYAAVAKLPNAEDREATK